MSKEMEIRLLPEETISRISAGEVIERPLNVVKELVENSIDAGSTAITVEIRDGGISMVRVTDNGCGIAKDQIAKAFVRHATSKIRDAEDLSRLSSLGFRGEALASIAAVAQVEMITKVRGEVSGTRAVNDHLAAYSPDAPVQISLEEIGAPDGTTVIVRNLFGSIPVRRRFLRQPQTEAGYITDLIEKQALSHPDISIHYRVNGQEKLHTSGNGSLQELIYRIYGRETAGAVIPVHAQDPESGMNLEGFIGRPEISRSSRSFETFFINGRMLHSKELSAGLEEGYRTDLMQHRFPFAVLHLTMPPEDIDVNVHPSKMEVRFTDRAAVLRFLDESVHQALKTTELIPKANLLTARQERAQKQKEARLKAQRLQEAPRYEAFEAQRMPSKPAAEPFSRPADRPSAVPVSPSADRPSAASCSSPPAGQTAGTSYVSAADEPSAGDFLFEDRRSYGKDGKGKYGQMELSDLPDLSGEEGSGKTDHPDPITEKGAARDGSEGEKTQDRILSREAAVRYKFIGQVFGTYWIIEYENRLLLIDQHAAHEKVNYERMMRRIARDHPALDAEGTARDAVPDEYLAVDRLLEPARQNRKDRTQEPVLVASQQLLPPAVLHLSGREETALRQYLNVFAMMGYEIEEFGSGSYAIRAVPTELFGRTADGLLREILEEIMEERISGTPRAILSKVASMSCKAAVKGSRRLSEPEARALIDELLTLENPYHCPHGRPTMIVLSQHELDRKFRRIV